MGPKKTKENGSVAIKREHPKECYLICIRKKVECEASKGERVSPRREANRTARKVLACRIRPHGKSKIYRGILNENHWYSNEMRTRDVPMMVMWSVNGLIMMLSGLRSRCPKPHVCI